MLLFFPLGLRYIKKIVIKIFIIYIVVNHFLGNQKKKKVIKKLFFRIRIRAFPRKGSKDVGYVKLGLHRILNWPDIRLFFLPDIRLNNYIEFNIDFYFLLII